MLIDGRKDLPDQFSAGCCLLALVLTGRAQAAKERGRRVGLLDWPSVLHEVLGRIPQRKRDRCNHGRAWPGLPLLVLRDGSRGQTKVLSKLVLPKTCGLARQTKTLRIEEGGTRTGGGGAHCSSRLGSGRRRITTASCWPASASNRRGAGFFDSISTATSRS